MTLYNDWQRDCDLMKKAVELATKRGKIAAEKEAAYYAAKAAKTLEMKADGYQVGIIDMTIKGIPEVNQALVEHLCAQAEYKSSLKAIDVYRDEARYLYDQLKREMSGDMNEY